MTTLYVPPDFLEAHERWRANCGPAALAAVLGKPLAEVRHGFPGFPMRPWTTPTSMRSALAACGATWKPVYARGSDASFWPRRGLAFIQWEGPWMAIGVPVRARYKYTHWVACAPKDARGLQVFDINAGEWLEVNVWGLTIAPRLLAGIPRAVGWHVQEGIEVQVP